MTKLPKGAEVRAEDRRCRWCRHVLPESQGPGRRKEFCSQKCRQWDWVARQRAQDLALSENELVMTRDELDTLLDLAASGIDRLHALQRAVLAAPAV